MIGFTEEEVRQMLTYYSTTSPFNHSVDELIEIMKPWYGQLLLCGRMLWRKHYV